MPFSLTNAPTIFGTLADKILTLFLDRFVFIYHDDIVIYNKSLEEHVRYLQKVLRNLKDNELHVKKENAPLHKKMGLSWVTSLARKGFIWA